MKNTNTNITFEESNKISYNLLSILIEILLKANEKGICIYEEENDSGIDEGVN